MKVLTILTGGETSLTEISNRLEVSKPMALKILGTLEGEGLVGSKIMKTKKGREKIYYLKPFTILLSYDPEKNAILAYKADSALDLENPLLGQIPQAEFRNSVAIYMDAVKNKFKKRNVAIVLFGSIARGNASEKSDIDLLILSDNWIKLDKNRLSDVLAGVAHRAEVQVISHFLTFDEFRSKSDTMTTSIKNEGILIYTKGQVNELWGELKRYRNIRL